MGIDVLHLIGIQSGIAQRIGHAARRTATIFRRRSHMVRITTHAKPDQLSIDGRAARLGVLQLFQHQGTGAIGQYETIASLIPRTTGPSRIIVTRGQCAGSRKAADAETTGGHFRATGQHHIGLTVGDIACSHTNAVSTSSASRRDGIVRPLYAQMDRQKPRNHIDNRARHEEWRNPSRPLLNQRLAAVFNISQAANAGADGHANTLTIGIGYFQA